MFREMLRAKVHRVTVTDANLDYEGSLTLDRALMDAAEIVPFEKVEIYNVTRGSRFSTYVIEGERGSGVCCVNGAAAHLAAAGDRIIVASYSSVPEESLASHKPVIVLVDARNRARDGLTSASRGPRGSRTGTSGDSRDRDGSARRRPRTRPAGSPGAAGGTAGHPGVG